MANLRLFPCLLAAAIIIGSCLGQSSYCDINRRHTMCRFHGPSPSCGRVLRQGVSREERDTIVNRHNELRSRIAMGKEQRGAPGPQLRASNMRELQWDDELAKIAQMWADQCRFEHDCGRCRSVSRFGVGQNLFATIGSGNTAEKPDWQVAVDGWYDEVKDFPKDDVFSFPSSSGGAMIGHYTAVVWAETSRVGCGFTNYVTDGRRTRMYICNYGETANFLGKPVYQPGRACSACPSGTRCSVNFRGLCSENTRRGSAFTGNAANSNEHPRPAQKPQLMVRPQPRPAQKPQPMFQPQPLPAEKPQPVSQSGRQTSSWLTPLMNPNSWHAKELPETSPVNAYAVKPDPESGCFLIRGVLICIRDKGSVIAMQKA